MRSLAHTINPGLEVVTCGSYRRGKPTCGDVDILVTHHDGRSHKGLLGTLLDRGHEDGFLTDDLAVSNDSNGSGKYLGVCKLPGEGRKVRERGSEKEGGWIMVIAKVYLFQIKLLFLLFLSLTLSTHAREGYSSRPVFLSVCLSVTL